MLQGVVDDHFGQWHKKFPEVVPLMHFSCDVTLPPHSIPPRPGGECSFHVKVLSRFTPPD